MRTIWTFAIVAIISCSVTGCAGSFTLGITDSKKQSVQVGYTYAKDYKSIKGVSSK